MAPDKKKGSKKAVPVPTAVPKQDARRLVDKSIAKEQAKRAKEQERKAKEEEKLAKELLKQQQRESRLRDEEAKRLEKIKADYEKHYVPLDPAIARLDSGKLLSVLLKSKAGWFGDPKKKLEANIYKRLGVKDGEAMTRGSLLAYARLKDVSKKVLKILRKEADERAKKAKKAKKAKAVKKAKRWRFIITSPAISRLLADLKETKRGWFGNPEKRLMKDVMKKLNINEEQAMHGEVLLSYAALPEVSQRLSEVRKERARKLGLKVLTPAGYERLIKVAPLPAAIAKAPAAEVPKERPSAISPIPSDLLSDLKQTQRGFFGDPEKRLVRDITKRLNVAESDALDTKNLDAYAELQDIRTKLDKIYERKEREALKESAKGAGKPEKAAKPGPQIFPKEKELVISATLSPEVSDRAKRIQELLEEQKAMADKEADMKMKRKRSAKAFAAPFKAINKAISFVIGKIFHWIFVGFTVILSIPINLGKIVSHAVGGAMHSIYARAGRSSPFRWKMKINQLIIYSGVNKTQEEITGITIVNGGILAAIIAAACYFLLGTGLIMAIIFAVISFGAAWVLVYAILNLMADKRTDEVESTLPDVLQIVSANISAGMTPYNALWVSARKEFGALAEEIKVAQKETLGGKSFAEALTDMAQRVRSNVLQRTIRLIIQGMKAGGELPSILQGIGNDIRQMRLLQKEMAASTMSYTMFILFGMILGAPLLFSVSIEFVDIMNKFQPEGIDVSAMEQAQSSPAFSGMQGFNVMSLGNKGCPKDFDGDGLPDTWEKENRLNSKNSSDAARINPLTGRTYLKDYQETAPPLSGSCITASYLSTFAMIALSSIAFFGSILIGLIRDGRQSAGLKLIPLLMPATLGMFILMRTGLGVFFGSMFGG